MRTKTIYIVRHGETDMNREERLQGQIDCDLNETGREEARRTLRIFGKAGISFGRIYSSPLKRALHTAEILADGAEVTSEPLITEMHFGDYEGTPYSDIDEAMWAFIRDPENVTPPEGVESTSSLVARTGAFLRRVISDGESGNILAVTHGIALRSMLKNLCGNGQGNVWGMPIENCVVYTVKCEDGRVLSVGRADELSQKNDSDTSGAF